jgi:hypothetical protein
VCLGPRRDLLGWEGLSDEAGLPVIDIVKMDTLDQPRLDDWKIVMTTDI